MMALVIKLAIVVLFASVINAEDEERKSFFSNFQELLNGKNLMDTVTCKNVNYGDFKFLLYTRENPEDPIHLDAIFPELDMNKTLVIITHGWVVSANTMNNIKKAYLYRYDCNVIVINWKKLAWDYYTSVVCKVPKIAKLIADFLCRLSNRYDMDLYNVHLVGHSLGAHVSGIVGHNTKQMCNQQIPRITGLDPAGPLFVDTPRPQRLDSSDAKFVDVIHTNGGVLGYFGNCGHADFYVNCGTVQLGCSMPDASLKSLINLPLAIGMCDHMRAIDIWSEAVETDNFKASPCYYCPLGCPPVLSMFKTKIIMGQKCPKEARGGYYVKTDYKAPYAITYLI